MKNYFQLALIVSLGVHALLLVGVPQNLFLDHNPRPRAQPEIKFVDMPDLPTPKIATLPKPSTSPEPPPYLSLKEKALNLAKQTKDIFTKSLFAPKAASNKEVTFLKPTEKLDTLPAYVS